MFVNIRCRMYSIYSFRASAGKTCSSVLTQEKVESRISPRQRRYFLGTSSSSRRKRIIILTLWIGNETRLFLEKHRNRWLSEAKTEILKQECRADFADRSIRELQRQIQSNHMEIGHPNLGYEQSRKEFRKCELTNSPSKN